MGRHRNTRRLLIAPAAALALALAGCTAATGPDGQASGQSGTPSSGGGEPVTIGLTYIPNVQFSPVYVADEDGLYAQQGLDATIRHHGSDEGLFTALAAGEEDVVVASGDEVLPARDQGLDLVSIGAYYRTYPVTVIVADDSPIRSVEDLRGRRIGVPGEYGSSWYGLLATLASASMTADDVQVVSIGYTQQAALASGQVDAVVGFTNNELVQFQQAGTPVRTVSPAGATMPLVGASLITTRAWLDAHPQQARAVVAGTVAGIRSVVGDPGHAVDVTRDFDDSLSGEAALTGTRAVLDATILLFTGATDSAGASADAVTGEQDLQRWADMGAFLQGVPGLLSAAPDVDAAVTNDAVPLP